MRRKTRATLQWLGDRACDQPSRDDANRRCALERHARCDNHFTFLGVAGCLVEDRDALPALLL